MFILISVSSMNLLWYVRWGWVVIEKSRRMFRRWVFSVHLVVTSKGRDGRVGFWVDLVLHLLPLLRLVGSVQFPAVEASVVVGEDVGRTAGVQAPAVHRPVPVVYREEGEVLTTVYLYLNRLLSTASMQETNRKWRLNWNLFMNLPFTANTLQWLYFITLNKASCHAYCFEIDFDRLLYEKFAQLRCNSYCLQLRK